MTKILVIYTDICNIYCCRLEIITLFIIMTLISFQTCMVFISFFCETQKTFYAAPYKNMSVKL